MEILDLETKETLIKIFNSALEKEKEAELYAKKLVDFFIDNGINLEMSQTIHTEEIKHQKIVEQMINLIQKG